MIRKRFFIICFLPLLLGCQDRFDDGKMYRAEYKGIFETDTGDSQEYKASEVTVLLDNETKHTITYNGNNMAKKGREIYGTLPNFTLFGVSSNAEISVKKEVFSERISGTFTTTIMYSSKSYDLDGTIVLEPY